MENIEKDADRFLTVEQLAARWTSTPDGIYQLRARGRGPRAHRIGKRILFKIADVREYEASRADSSADRASA